MGFITVDAAVVGSNDSRPTHLNVDSIAYVTSSGDDHDPDSPAAIYVVGSFTPTNRLVVRQTATQVRALIDAALAG